MKVQTPQILNDMALAGDPSDQTASTSATIELLTRRYGELRSETRLLNIDVVDGHRQAQTRRLEERTAAKARGNVFELLEQLSVDRGMTWSSIARLSGVSVSAVRKWRRGESLSPNSRHAIARLTAFLDLLDELPIDEPAAWMAMPLVNGYTVTGEDLYVNDNVDELLDLASGHIQLEAVLDSFEPSWRDHFQSNYEVFEAGDGNRSFAGR